MTDSITDDTIILSVFSGSLENFCEYFFMNEADNDNDVPVFSELSYPALVNDHDRIQVRYGRHQM